MGSQRCCVLHVSRLALRIQTENYDCDRGGGRCNTICLIGRFPDRQSVGARVVMPQGWHNDTDTLGDV